MYKKLRNIRKQNHYTSSLMAESLKISKAYYTQIEKGTRRLSYPMAISIANIFGMTPDKVFYDDFKDNIVS